MKISYACLGVGALRLLIVYFSLIPVSIPCGVLFGCDLAFHRLIRTILRIMLFSLFVLHEVRELGVPYTACLVMSRLSFVE